MRKQTKTGLKVGVALAAAVSTVAISQMSKASPIGGGDLVVLRTGDGANTFNGSATAISLLDYQVTYTGAAPTGLTLSQTIAVPGTNTGTVFGSGTPHGMWQGGTAGGEGGLALSTDGAYMAFTGYNANAVNQPTVGNGATATNPLGVVGLLRLSDGVLDTSTANTRVTSSNAMRGAFTTNGTDIWAATSGQGIRYMTLGQTTTSTALSGTSNTRRVYAYTKGNSSVQLYQSSATGTTDGVSTVGTPPPPTSGTPAVTPLTGMPNTTAAESPYDFIFMNDSTLYMAEDVAASTGGLGLQKWVNSAPDGSGTWTVAWNHAMTSTGGTLGIKSLGGFRDGNGNDILFASTVGTGQNYLVGLEVPAGDTNGSGVIENVLANSGVDFGGINGDWNLRGVAVAPSVPEPASLALIAAGAGALLLRRPKSSKRTISLPVIETSAV